MLHENAKWPVLMISDEFDRKNDDASRLGDIIRCLENDFDCNVIKS